MCFFLGRGKSSICVYQWAQLPVRKWGEEKWYLSSTSGSGEESQAERSRGTCGQRVPSPPPLSLWCLTKFFWPPLQPDRIIKQQSLVLSSRPIRLKNVFIRPNISNRRSVGTLEAHTNGFRFISTKGEKIGEQLISHWLFLRSSWYLTEPNHRPIHPDILYNNIQFSFFQLPEKETIILVHFRLIFEILVGKKSSKDIQFCQEASELSTSVSK